MSKLSALIGRVEKCTGSDRMLDSNIMAALFPAYVGGIKRWDAHQRDLSTYHLTGSLESVVTLIEKAMPDALWEVNGYGAACVWPHWVDGNTDEQYSETNARPHIALLLAFLRAKESLSA